MDRLERYPWPGNVRELENAIQRAVIVCSGNVIESWDLGLGTSGWRRPAARDSAADMDYASSKQKVVEEFQRQFVHRALQSAKGNVSHAAEACGMTRAALQRILRQLDIDREEYR